mmetsp:Transcript_21892/g.64606  ORF Transcript_21892/g.64606 Transcript_21892/m.64606 type:complete len:239 (-) Transcript_21892:103-819(-)
MTSLPYTPPKPATGKSTLPNVRFLHSRNLRTSSASSAPSSSSSGGTPAASSSSSTSSYSPSPPPPPYFFSRLGTAPSAPNGDPLTSLPLPGPRAPSSPALPPLRSASASASLTDCPSIRRPRAGGSVRGSISDVRGTDDAASIRAHLSISDRSLASSRAEAPSRSFLGAAPPDEEDGGKATFFLFDNDGPDDLDGDGGGAARDDADDSDLTAEAAPDAGRAAFFARAMITLLRPGSLP